MGSDTALPAFSGPKAAICCLVAVAAMAGQAGGAAGSWAQGASGHRLAAGSNPGKQLKQIEKAAQGEAGSTFRLTYASKSSAASPASQVALEQKPPEQLFRTGSGEVIYNGKTTYYCAVAGSPPTCVAYGKAGQDPLSPMLSFYSAATYVRFMQAWEGLIADRVAGYRITFSRATFARQPSECVTWGYRGSSAKYCVTDKGILAYVGGSGPGASSSFALTSYSARVSSSDFRLPKGAVVTTVP